MPPILRDTPDGWSVLEIRGARDVPDYDPKVIGQGMSQGKYRTEVLGDWSATTGRVVYPEFGEIHKAVDPLAFDPYRPLLCAWDVGGTPISGVPSCVVTQVNALHQWLIFSCIIPDEDAPAVGIWEFAGWVQEHLRTEFAEPWGMSFPDLKLVHVGDPQGHVRPPKTYGMVSKGYEIKSCYDVIEKGYKQEIGEDDRGRPVLLEKPGYGWRIREGERSLARRMEMLRGLLTTLVEGRPALVVDPRCKFIVDGFEGGYHYHQRSDGRYELDPMKNHYSHALNAVEYGASYLKKAYDKSDERERYVPQRTITGPCRGGR